MCEHTRSDASSQKDGWEGGGVGVGGYSLKCVKYTSSCWEWKIISNEHASNVDSDPFCIHRDDVEGGVFACAVVSSRTIPYNTCTLYKDTMNCGEDLLEIVRLESVLEYVHSLPYCFCAIWLRPVLQATKWCTRIVCLHSRYYSVLLHIYHYLFKSGKYYICAFAIQFYCTILYAK